MFQGCLTPLYCFSLFSPTLTANLGYTAAKAQLVSLQLVVRLSSVATDSGVHSMADVRSPLCRCSFHHRGGRVCI